MGSAGAVLIAKVVSLKARGGEGGMAAVSSMSTSSLLSSNYGSTAGVSSYAVASETSSILGLSSFAAGVVVIYIV